MDFLRQRMGVPGVRQRAYHSARRIQSMRQRSSCDARRKEMPGIARRTPLRQGSGRVGGELEDGAGLVPLARPQDGRGEVRLVRGVGEVLRLQAEAGAPVVDDALLPGERAVEEVARVE